MTGKHASSCTPSAEGKKAHLSTRSSSSCYAHTQNPSEPPPSTRQKGSTAQGQPLLPSVLSMEGKRPSKDILQFVPHSAAFAFPEDPSKEPAEHSRLYHAWLHLSANPTSVLLRVTPAVQLAHCHSPLATYTCLR